MTFPLFLWKISKIFSFTALLKRFPVFVLERFQVYTDAIYIYNRARDFTLRSDLIVLAQMNILYFYALFLCRVLIFVVFFYFLFKFL